tara:strand:+ start:84 stop:1013 length:930 start_codon:yes stop_codon:yes gene_type:complete
MRRGEAMTEKKCHGCQIIIPKGNIRYGHKCGGWDEECNLCAICAGEDEEHQVTEDQVGGGEEHEVTEADVIDARDMFERFQRILSQANAIAEEKERHAEAARLAADEAQQVAQRALKDANAASAHMQEKVSKLAEREAREKAEREARENAEREKAERKAREKAEREAREAAEQEALKKAEKAAQMEEEYTAALATAQALFDTAQALNEKLQAQVEEAKAAQTYAKTLQGKDNKSEKFAKEVFCDWNDDEKERIARTDPPTDEVTADGDDDDVAAFEKKIDSACGGRDPAGTILEMCGLAEDLDEAIGGF